MTVKEINERLAALFREGIALGEKSERDGLTDEEVSRVDAIKSEVTDLRARKDRAEKATAAFDEFRSGHREYNEPAGQRASGLIPRDDNGQPKDGGQRQERDSRSIAQRFTQSDSYTDYLQRGARGSSSRVGVGSHFLEPDTKPLGETELRALVYNTFVAGFQQPVRVGGINRFERRTLRVREAFLNVPITQNNYEFVRELAPTNNAAEVAEATTVAGATAKPESAINFEVVSGAVKTVAHHIPVTRQMLQDQGFIEGMIEQSLLVGLDERIDLQLLLGDGTGANIRGLNNVTGIQDLNNTPTTGYFATNPVQGAGTPIERRNRIRRAIRTIATSTAGRGTATFIIISPADAELLETQVNTESQYLGPWNWGLDVIISEIATAGIAWVGDGRQAMVLDRMDGQIFMTDSHSDWFLKNLIAILAEARLDFAVMRPSAFARVALT